MKNQELINKIMSKKEFSELPLQDVKRALKKFDKSSYSDEEKIKFTRDLLRRVFSSFLSKKLLNLKDKKPEWILKKHLSTRERLHYYKDIYKIILEDFSSEKEVSLIDLGAGVNGFSYQYIKEVNSNIRYLGIESIGQIVDLMNNYFKKNNLNASAVKMSLFELDSLKELIKKQKKPRIILLLKVIDSLELLEKNYSKKFLLELKPFADRFVLSFATKSFFKRKSFRAKRKWIKDFIEDNFKVLKEFEFGGEKYFVFQ